MFTTGYSSRVRKGLLLVNRDRFSSNLVPRVLFPGLGGPAPPPKPGKSTLGTRLILLIQILYNAVKRLLRQKSFKYYNFPFPPPPPPPPPLGGSFVSFFFFFNHIVFTYWLVSICLHCCPFTPSRGVAINVFHVVTIIRLTNKNDVVVQIAYFTVFERKIYMVTNVLINIYIYKKHEEYLII